MQVAYRSFDGRYSDNPRALYEAVLARGDEVDEFPERTVAEACVELKRPAAALRAPRTE